MKPYEVLVIDQNPPELRDKTVSGAFPDLPIKTIYLDRIGQCTARNAGLSISQGEYILFLDDDDEIAPNLIELHLRTLDQFRCSISSGVADEVGAGPLPENFRHLRISDVFPTNNTMIRRSALVGSGLFDLAYDRGQNEDGDLGMRVYLSGALMILDPRIVVLHHHAPVGGLRAHNARVVTYASSRQKLRQRNLPSVSELYLTMRYFKRTQLHETLWLRVLGTFSLHGGPSKRLAKTGIALVYLPDTLWKIRQHRRRARAMLTLYPQIPNLPTQDAEARVSELGVSSIRRRVLREDSSAI